MHSLHSYFLLPGDNVLPILYRVKRTRDGRQFSTRTVVAQQRGRPIFAMMASFQRTENFELEHQFPMPTAPDPSTVPSEEDNLRKWSQDPSFPKRFQPWIELRLSQVNCFFLFMKDGKKYSFDKIRQFKFMC